MMYTMNEVHFLYFHPFATWHIEKYLEKCCPLEKSQHLEFMCDIIFEKKNENDINLFFRNYTFGNNWLVWPGSR